MSSRTKTVILFIFSTIVLFLGFDRNLLGLVPAQAFADFDKGSESLVLGRLVRTRQSGFFADGALLGSGDARIAFGEESDFIHQYQTYLDGGQFQTYAIYKSQSGGQAWFFSLLDALSPFSPALNLRLFHALTALLTALALAALIVWFHIQFGWTTTLVVLFTTLASQWPTLYGRNLFYAVWDYFLPMVAALFLLEREARGGVLNERRFYLTIGLLLFIKCLLSGYDFLLPPMGMAATALVYYAIRNKWRFRQFARRLLLTGLACALGVAASFLVLAAQIGTVSGNFSDGLLHILNTLGRRTFGTPLDPSQSDFFTAGQQAELVSVIQNIARKTAIAAGIRFSYIFWIFAAVSLLIPLVLYLRRSKPGELCAGRALLITTWISFLSPLAWLVIFKAHAYYHPFTTAIIWHMPTMFFGYALIGLLLKLVFQRPAHCSP